MSQKYLPKMWTRNFFKKYSCMDVVLNFCSLETISIPPRIFPATKNINVYSEKRYSWWRFQHWKALSHCKTVLGGDFQLRYFSLSISLINCSSFINYYWLTSHACNLRSNGVINCHSMEENLKIKGLLVANMWFR